ncbi:unnamed protein product, partial [Prorocentrum cordatum]
RLVHTTLAVPTTRNCEGRAARTTPSTAPRTCGQTCPLALPQWQGVGASWQRLGQEEEEEEEKEEEEEEEEEESNRHGQKGTLLVQARILSRHAACSRCETALPAQVVHVLTTRARSQCIVVRAQHRPTSVKSLRSLALAFARLFYYVSHGLRAIVCYVCRCAAWARLLRPASQPDYHERAERASSSCTHDFQSRTPGRGGRAL